MPNWVSNVIVFETQKKDPNLINEIFEFIHGKENGKELEIDFNKIIPTPEELDTNNDSADSTYAQFYIYYLKNKKEYLVENNLPLFEDSSIKDFINRSFKIPFFNTIYIDKATGFTNIDFDKLDIEYIESHLWIKSGKDIKDALIRGADVIRKILLYGFSNWYDFHCSLWGTKWNAKDTTRINCNSIGFLSAWSSPEPIVCSLSKRYPDVYITVYYADEGGIDYNSGIYTYKDGHIIHERPLSSTDRKDVILYYNIIDFDLDRSVTDDVLKDELDYHYKRGDYEENEFELEEDFLEKDSETQKQILDAAKENGYNKAVINIKSETNNK